MWDETGYTIDVPFVPGYHADTLPATLETAVGRSAADSLAVGGGFSYLDLGAGFGLTAALVAALYPASTVYCVDFHPEHTLSAERFRARAGLENLTVINSSFERLEQGTLPQFDFIILNAVLSWVSPREQDLLAELLGAKLAPNGIAYVSYNALPGLAEIQPLQRLLLSMAEKGTGSSVERFAAAIERVRSEHVQADSLFFSRRPALLELLASFAGRSPNYLVHEYLHKHWQPFYLDDIVSRLRRQGLDLAASLGSEDCYFAELAASRPDSDPQSFDYSIDRRFRRDLFTRTECAEPRQSLDLVAVQLLQPVRQMTSYIEGTWLGRTAAARALADAFTGKEPFQTVTVRTPAAADRLCTAHLLGCGFLGVARHPTEGEVRAASRYNNALLATRDREPIDHARPFAASRLHAGIRA